MTESSVRQELSRINAQQLTVAASENSVLASPKQLLVSAPVDRGGTSRLEDYLWHRHPPSSDDVEHLAGFCVRDVAPHEKGAP